MFIIINYLALADGGIMTNTIKNEMLGVSLFGSGGYMLYVLICQGDIAKAGYLGQGLNEVLRFLFGDFVWGLPIAFIIYGLLFIVSFNNSLKINKLKLVSIILCLIFVMALSVVLTMPKDGMKQVFFAGFNGNSGGALGTIIAAGLYYIFGKTGEIFVLLTLIAITAVVFANKMLKSIITNIGGVFDPKNFEKDVKNEKRSSRSEMIKKELKEKKESNEENEEEKEYENREKKLNSEFEEKEHDVKKKEVIINSDAINSFESEKKNQDRAEDTEKKGLADKLENKEEKKSENKEEKDLDDIFVKKGIDHKKIAEIENSIKQKSRLLEEALKHYGVEAKVVNYCRGPVITRFELTVPRGMRVKKITALTDDIAMNLEAKSIRIEAPIPGKNAIGIEIPNDIQEAVYFSSIFNSEKIKESKKALDIILGKNIVGEDVVIDLAKMPHLLVAGRTGSGKSVCINTLISTILSRTSHEDVKFIMVDPKMVELMPFNGIPHLLVPVITEPKQAAVALKWAVNEMENRYRTLAKAGVRNIEGYNNLKGIEKLSYIVVVIDELADLMMVAPASIEESIARIAQKARAIGIHLVVATQRPSVDVITGTIKANLPSRISFAVASQIDSRTILDTQGAEKLLGKGDMLFLESGSPNLVRIQGAYVSDDEVVELTNYLKRKGAPVYKEEILAGSLDADVDELFEQAVEIIKSEGKASISLLQRKLKVGYARAARIFDQLEEAGIVIDERN